MEIGKVRLDKKRIFSLDLIRVVAMWMIIIYHFQSLLISWNIQIVDMPQKRLVFYVYGIDMGILGVSLFFIVSGFSLMYVYENKLELKSYLCKRFVAIYPLFWLSYLTCLTLIFILYKGQVYHPNAPKWKWLLTFFGIDGYFHYKGIDFYLIGEWFLGAIIFLYALFPLFRKMIKSKYWKVYTVLLTILYIGIVIWYPFKTSMVATVLVRYIDFYFGMLLIKYYKKIDWKTGIIALIIFLLFTHVPILNTTKCSYLIIGWTAFLVLFVLGNIIDKIVGFKIIKGIFSLFSKYSFTIFLFHHRAQIDFFRTIGISQYTKQSIVIVFLICCFITCVLAYFVQNMWNNIYKEFFADKKIKFKEE